MQFKNILLVVNDIEKSKVFYRELFGLEVIADFGGNVMLTERLVLQERKNWEAALGCLVQYGGHDAELYFEESCMDEFLQKLKKWEPGVSPVNYVSTVESASQMEERDWGQRVIRIYDPDYHVIEIAETTEGVVRRLKAEGLSLQEIAEKVRLPLDMIEEEEDAH